jgi:hypothetical protein
MFMPPASHIHDVDELIHLKRRRNALVPICRLPSELLLDIFRFLQGLDNSSFYSVSDGSAFSFMPVDNRWSRIMRVCYYFHRLACDTPALWSVLDFTAPRCSDARAWRALCVERSAGAPLCLRVRDEDGVALLNGAWKAALEDDVVAASALNERAPRLRVLSVQTLQPFRLTSAFLGGDATRLTHLRAIKVDARVMLTEAPRLACLRRLELCAVQTPPDLRFLVALLAHTPMLQWLRLSSFFFHSSQTRVHPSRIIPVPERVALPHLKVLSIEDTTAEASALVRLLPIPSASFQIIMLQTGPDHDGTEDEDDRVFDLNENHSIVYGRYAEFTRTQALPGGDLCEGRLEVDSDDPVQLITFGQNRHTQGTQVSFCEIECIIYAPHPILTHVRTMHIVNDLPTQEEFEDVWTPRVLPALDTIIFKVHPFDQDAAWLPMIKEWLVQHEGRIVRIEFVSCVRWLEPLVHALQQEKVAFEVVWK